LDIADIVRILWYNIKKYTMKNFNWYRIGGFSGICTLFYFISIWEDPTMSLDSYLQKVILFLIAILIYDLQKDVRNLKNK
jgi:hypothetical protein